MKPNLKTLTVLVAGVLLLGLSSVAAYAGGLVDTTFNVDNFGEYSADITNPYWTLNPYLPGNEDTTFVYNTKPKVGDGCEINYVYVTDQTKEIAGVETREVQDWVYVDEDCDGEPDYLSENTLDWYAQDNDGNVWYLGEYTEEYSCDPPNPGCTSTEGTWDADMPDAEPGIVMMAQPTTGAFYQQEYLEDEAEDEAKVLRVNARVNLTFKEDNPNDINPGEYEDCVKTKEWSPLELGVVEHKYYCDGLLLLVNELQGGTVRTELVDYYSGTPRDVSAPGFINP